MYLFLSLCTGKSVKTFHPFSFEFLEPYSSGDCAIHNNCLSCMTDSQCGWCDPMNKCIHRNKSTDECGGDSPVSFMITEPSVCPMCSDHVECTSCAQVSC